VILQRNSKKLNNFPASLVIAYDAEAAEIRDFLVTAHAVRGGAGVANQKSEIFEAPKNFVFWPNGNG